MSYIRENPPPLVNSKEELFYYEYICDQLNDNNVPVKDQDALTIGVFAANLAMLDECNKNILDHGMMMQVQGDRVKISRTNPAIALRDKCEVAVRFYFKEFHMTPNSRGSRGGVKLPNNPGNSKKSRLSLV